MFPVTLTFTINTPEQLRQVLAFATPAPTPSAGVTANEKAAVLQANETALADTVDPTAARGTPPAVAESREAPGKSADKPAATPSTATTAAASTAKSEPASPTAPTASAPAAGDAPAFEYATLQKAVNAAVPKHGKDALLAIAKKHGGATFKDLAASTWQAAYDDVVALG